MKKQETLMEMVRRIIKEEDKTFRSFPPQQKPGDYQIGDIVGNTVQGFDFEVKSIVKDSVTVKNTKTGEVGKYYILNFYKPAV